MALRLCIVSSLAFALSACQVIPPEPQAGDLIVCVDPFQMVGGIDYNCGEEIVIVASIDPISNTLLFAPFRFERPGETGTRFLLLNDTSVDMEMILTITIGGVAQVFDDIPLRPGEGTVIDTECAESITWGDLDAGLCLFEPATAN